MIAFKLWLQENLAGPGDGPDSAPFDLERMYLANKGSAGALRHIGNDTPKATKTATANYLDPQHIKKMKLKMKKK
jgi:hypothetical protein